MRAIQFLSAVAFAGMLFTSCQDDSLVQKDINPTATLEQRDLPVEQTIQFTSWQTVAINPPDCALDVSQYKQDKNEDAASLVAGCMGEYGFLGQGHGFLEGFDRFLVKTHVNFDPNHNMFLGSIQFDFSSSESALLLKMEGPGQTYQNEDGTSLICVPVIVHSGSGVFENIAFEGVLKIMHADEIFDASNTDYYATLIVEGEIFAL